MFKAVNCGDLHDKFIGPCCDLIVGSVKPRSGMLSVDTVTCSCVGNHTLARLRESVLRVTIKVNGEGQTLTPPSTPKPLNRSTPKFA